MPTSWSTVQIHRVPAEEGAARKCPPGTPALGSLQGRAGQVESTEKSRFVSNSTNSEFENRFEIPM